MQKLDVAIYLRKSRADVEEETKANESGDEFDALAKHRRELYALARKSKHNVLDIFEEVVSGESIAARPEMKKLLQNVIESKYEAVLVMDIDRLGRGQKVDQGRIENAFRDTGTLIVTPSSIYDLTQEEGEFNVEVKTFLANMEYRSIKKRLQRGLIQAAKQGKHIGGQAPFGYKTDEESKLVVDPANAKVVRSIFKQAAAGKGLRTIRKRLAEKGIASPTGKELWGITTIKRILTNKKYAGIMTYGARQHRKTEDGRYIEKSSRDASKYFEVPGAHEAIVPLETFEQAQAVVSRRNPRVNMDKELIFPLAGVLICGKCGRRVRLSAPKDSDERYLYCGSSSCKQHGSKESEFNIVFRREITAHIERLASDNIKRSKETIERERRRDLKRADELNETLSELDERKERVFDFFERGEYDQETFRERLDKVQDEQRRGNDELREIQARLAATPETFEERQDVIDDIVRALEMMDAGEDVESVNELFRSRLVSLVYDRVKTTRNDVKIDEIRLKIATP